MQSKDELATTRAKQIQTYKSEYMENVASVLMTYDGLGTNDEILRALENKYDTLRDKLLLDALRKQLGGCCVFSVIRDLKQTRTATAVNKPLNFTVKNKPHTTNYIYCIFYD